MVVEGQLGSSSKKNMENSSSPCSNSQSIRPARLLFIACLGAVAAVLGFAAHELVSNSEEELARRQFDSMAERSLEQARSNSFRRLEGTVAMALLYSTQFPNASAWPYVVLEGFDEVAASLMKMSSGRTIGFAPWVPLEQLPDWEAWAIQYIEENYGPDAGASSFGKGVFGYDLSLNNTDYRYHDTTGESLYGSPYRLIAPVIQRVDPNQDRFLLNVHNSPGIRFGLDLLLEESERRKNSTGAVPAQLGSITPPVYYISYVDGPSTVHMHPIYPRNDVYECVGHVGVSIGWMDVLYNVFPSELDGVDCVLESDGQFFTYTVVQGTVSFLGPDDLHDRSFDDQGVSLELVQTENYVKGSPSYRLWLYPNDRFSEVYSTNNTTIAPIGAVCVIVFTSLMFLLYDFIVRKQFHHKEAVLDAKRSFMRFISHEVRTPLNTVCMGVELMQEELRSLLAGPVAHHTQKGNPEANDDVATINSEKASEILILSEQIHANADSAVDILNDLLNYDKIEQGQLTLELTVIPIWALLERTVKEFSLAASSKKIDLSIGFQFEGNEIKQSVSALTQNEKALRVIGDTVRITQVVRNLISNALKFTKKGQISVTACHLAPTNRIGSDPFDEFELNGCEGRHRFIRSGRVRIDVKDSGVGMTEEQLKKLFGQGVQFNVNELQAGKGSGLGLWITKGLVEQHKGKLAASSEGLGSGSTFSCTLPIYHVPDTTLPSNLLHLKVENAKPFVTRNRDQTESGPIDDPELTNGQVRVLIVDDAALNRKMLSQLLTNRGYLCDEAENGEDAVNMVKKAMDNERCYDSILMDYEMPVMDGPSSVAMIRSIGCGAFVIGITGNVLPEDVAHFKNCGANSVFGKPVNVQGVISLWCEYGVI